MRVKNIKKIGIIGVGFMGASFALAVKKELAYVSVWGYARKKSSFDRLNRLNILDGVSRNLNEVIGGADLVVLAMPVLTIIDYFKKIRPFLKKGAVIIDLGSSKASIVEAAKKFLPKNVSFVGCHPLCGSHKKGAQNANKNIYKGAVCIITSKKNAASLLVEKLWNTLGCRVHYFDYYSHDTILSYVSHLPHIISFSLTKFVPKKYLKIAPTSFKDLTRISFSPPQVWAEIFISNRKNLLKCIREYIEVLEIFEMAIKVKDKPKLLGIIKKINIKQKAIQS